MLGAIGSINVSIFVFVPAIIVAFVAGIAAFFFVAKNNLTTLKKAVAILGDHSKSDAEKMSDIASVILPKIPVVGTAMSVVGIIKDTTISDTDKIKHISTLLGV